MWLLLAFASAALLGFYDVFKKKSLKDNAVLPVLFLNTLFSSLIFLPFILLSAFAPQVLGGTIFDVPVVGWGVHKFVIIKSFIVLSSWIFGYFGMKHLPLTIVGPINATRPVMVLVGAMLIFGERLNLYQWIGVMLAILSFFMLSRSGKKEGIDFKHNKWIFFIVLAALAGAISGLYDKYLMKQFNPMVVQSWYNVYQVFIMCPILALLWWPKRNATTPFRWDWTIILISIFLCAADFVYFYALSDDDSMISIVSMVRRSSVVISFIFGAWVFREKNLKSKAIDLVLVLIGMFFLYLGTTPKEKDMSLKLNEPRNIRGVISYKRSFGDLNDVHLTAAKALGIRPLASREEAEKMKEQLTPITNNEYYAVDSLTHSLPFLVPRASHLLDSIGANFLDSLTAKGLNPNKIVITSVLRTKEDVKRLRLRNGNASENSAHFFGTTFDVSWKRFLKVEDEEGRPLQDVSSDTLKLVLSEVLRDLRKADKCYIKYELKQGCFHITTR